LEQALTDRQNASAIDDPHACESCGRAPARRLVIRRHVGMLYLQKFVKIEPTLCRECGTRTVMRYTGRTLIQGWWGLISLLIANPFTIVMNLVALVQARRLPPPQLSSI
jgi:ribosomal protein L37AE/L43A